MLFKYFYIHKKEESLKLIRSLVKTKILSDNFHSLPTKAVTCFCNQRDISVAFFCLCSGQHFPITGHPIVIERDG